MNAWARFKADFRRYAPMENGFRLRSLVRTLWEAESLWVVASYRAGQYLHQEAPTVVRRVLKIPWSVTHRFLRQAIGVHLFPQTPIGPGLYIGHSGGVWISPRAKLGAHCNVNHGATIGVAGPGPGPTLGNRVWVGPNATISGDVSVGDEAVIAANSLVVAKVPERAVVIGVPAKVVSRGGSARLIDPIPYAPRRDTAGPGTPATDVPAIEPAASDAASA